MYLTQGLHRTVQQTPDLPATIFGDRTRTWADSARRVARFAGALRALGVGSGDRVGILANNSDIYHEYMLAVPWADAVLTPANTRWSAAEIAFSLQDSDTRVLLVDDAFVPMLPRLHAEAPVLRTVIYIGDGSAPDGALDLEELIAGHDPIPDARRGGDSLAGVYYTGGTTGKPKGVMLSHLNLLTSALGATASGTFMVPGGRLLHAAPMFHLADGAAWVARTSVGGTHVIVPGFTPAGVADAIERHRVTDVLLVPTMVQMLVDSPDTADSDLSSLCNLIYGASPISEALLERAGKRMPTAAFTQAYGMTELSPVATLLSPGDHGVAGLRRSAGRAAPHAEVRIVDDEDREVPNGTVGEIVCRGSHVMLGYWNRPEETEAALRGGWMHTGDGGYLDDDGYLFVVDRIKDMIVSGGENVYSVEVENALGKHPSVASCAVIGVPDEDWGERVHAVVVLTGDTSPTAEDLRAHVKEHIAGYKAPRTVEFVDSLPLSGAGKILKRDLRARYWGEGARNVH
ncbi:acyl-CoA synthetase [Pseudonocardia spinosispora]|uniref:acyl-CoA synthetase n=1 Tax=Pseudonocardia spinosispora TaxID=103441 RepID=UPI0004026521|nr:long-chain fatty acid--CoA ligase [Pseudonocardia spinosispora]